MLRSCPRCGRSAAPHIRFCEYCGTPVSDNTTRYLCAAVHRDSEYCDAAIAEFLVEPVRALPPSAGADSAAVLRGAVAARTRRRIRDGALLVGLLFFALLDIGLFVGWLAVALVGWFATGAAARGTNRASVRTAIAVSVGLVVLYLVVDLLLGAVGLSPEYLAYQLTLLLGGGTAALGVSSATMVLTFLMFAVLLTDEYLVHWLVHTRFRRDRFVTDSRHLQSAVDPLQVALRTLGGSTFRRELERVAAADRAGHLEGRADVVVHREFSPFVGAGVVVTSHAVPFSLVADEDGAGTVPVDVVGLHEQISAALAAIKGASSLGPSGRLNDLEMREQVLVPSEQLVTHGGAFPQPVILPTLDRPPATSVDISLARGLADEPVEWARYYRCYQVETWDRDLTASCYVHIGTDQKLLYLERVHCVVPPLAAHFRRVDEPPNPVEPLGNALVALFLLPASTLRRLRTALGGYRRLRQRPGEVVPDRYGAARSLRELASTTEFRTYFQSADAARYRGIVDAILIRAVGRYLEEHGYSVVEFQETVAPVFQSFHGSTFNNSSFGPNARTYNTAPGPGSPQEKP
jgi:hypothetical protein